MEHFVIYTDGKLTTGRFVIRSMPTEGFTDPATWNLPTFCEVIAVIHDTHAPFRYTLRNEVIDALPR